MTQDTALPPLKSSFPLGGKCLNEVLIHLLMLHSQASSEQEAKTSCAEFSAIANTRNSPHLRSPSHPDLDASDDDVITVPLVVKGDVAGSVEALLNILTARQPLRFRLKVVHSGVGPISESDMDMAISTKGRSLGFRSKVVHSGSHLYQG